MTFGSECDPLTEKTSGPRFVVALPETVEPDSVSDILTWIPTTVVTQLPMMEWPLNGIVVRV